MPRRSELLEEERNYRLVKREKEESGALVKQVLRFLFSQVGVVILGVITAVLGNVCNQINSGVSCLVIPKLCPCFFRTIMDRAVNWNWDFD